MSRIVPAGFASCLLLSFGLALAACSTEERVAPVDRPGEGPSSSTGGEEPEPEPAVRRVLVRNPIGLPVDNLMAAPVLETYVRGLGLQGLCVVSPDAGGVGRARHFAKRLEATLAIIDKRRPEPGVARAMHVIGDVQGRDVLLYDDMVDTAGTLAQAAQALREAGARRILAACTHPVLSGPAVERIDKSEIERLIVSDTIPLGENARSSRKIVVLSVAELFGETIRRISLGQSVSSLFL